MKGAKVFKHGNRKISYARVMAAVSQFKGKVERRQPKDQKRTWR